MQFSDFTRWTISFGMIGAAAAITVHFGKEHWLNYVAIGLTIGSPLSMFLLPEKHLISFEMNGKEFFRILERFK